MGIQERKEREFQRREREILDAALGLFATEDWQAVTVEQIAERAEIGKGTVYKHFASKDEIYARLAAELQEETVAKLERIDATLPVLRRLRAVIAVVWEHARVAEEHQRLVQYCEREEFRKSLPASLQEELAELDARFEGVIYRVLQDGIDQGILPHKRPEALVFGPMAALHGAIRLARCGIPADVAPEQYQTELTNFILAGMLYQEWLAEEGLEAAEATRRAIAEAADVEAELESEKQNAKH